MLPLQRASFPPAKGGIPAVHDWDLWQDPVAERPNRPRVIPDSRFKEPVRKGWQSHF